MLLPKAKAEKNEKETSLIRIVVNAHHNRMVGWRAQYSHAFKWLGHHPGVSGVHLQELAALIQGAGRGASHATRMNTICTRRPGHIMHLAGVL